MNRFRLIAMVAIVAVLLAACGEEAEQRRFATDEQPSFVAASPPVIVVSTAAASPVVVPVLSPESLLAGAEATGTVFMIRDDSVWSIDLSSGAERLVYSAPNNAPLVLAVDDVGERVAVLTGDSSQGQPTTLLVLRSDGTTIQRFDGVETSFEDAAETVTPVSLDWSHDGQRLLAGFRGGGLLDVPLTGKPSVILGPKRLPYLDEARWSPSSDMIAFVARSAPDSAGRLFIAKPRGGATDPVAVAPARTSTGQSVRSLAWAQNGEAILYLQTSSTNEITGQDLFEVSPVGEDRRLVASSGRVAPVGGIERFAVSPDGRSVAYAIYVPGLEEPVFNSLWIESLESATRYQVPVDTGNTVTALRWVAGGLLWETTGTGTGGTPALAEPVLYSLGEDLIPRRVDDRQATPESATPMSSPNTPSPAA